MPAHSSPGTGLEIGREPLLYFLYSNETDEAIKVFAFSVGKYPDSAKLYDSLAAAFEQAGQLREAIESQEMAVQKSRAGLNYDDIHGVGHYEARLEELRAKKQN